MYLTTLRRLTVAVALLLVGMMSFPFSKTVTNMLAQGETIPFTLARDVRTFDNDDLGLSNPVGLAFYQDTNTFFVLEAPTTGQTNIVWLTTHGEKIDSATVEIGITDFVNAAYDSQTSHLLYFDPDTQELIQIELGTAGNELTTGPITRSRLDDLGPRDPGSIVARGLAINPSNGHLYFLSPPEQRVYEINRAGALAAIFDLSPAGLIAPRSLVVAPSGDPTDDPALMNLYVVDSGRANESSSATVTESGGSKSQVTGMATGQIVELSVAPPVPVVANVVIDPVVLVKTTQTHQFSPPSSDPAGLAYLPNSNSLLISDSEVNEIPDIFTGDNLFRTTLSGNLIATLTTISFSDEPTGVAYNPANNHLFFSDDTGTRSVYELDPGPDGLYNTQDDLITSIATGAFGSTDPEGVTFDTSRGHLIVVDGVGREVYDINPGPNGVFDGVPPAGDDVVTHFDVTAIGIEDPEGIEFNPDNGHLYILSSEEDLIAETLIDGTLMRYLDTTSINAVKAAGLAYAPASTNPAARHLYIVDRVGDNVNDGRLYEVSFPSGPPVTATPSDPTSTPTRTPTNTPTNTPTRTPTSTPTSTPTRTPTGTPTPIGPQVPGEETSILFFPVVMGP